MMISPEIAESIYYFLYEKFNKLKNQNCGCSGCEKIQPERDKKINEIKEIIDFFDENNKKLHDLKENGYYFDVKIEMKENIPIANYELVYID